MSFYDSDGRREQYPGAPQDPKEREAWLAARNRAIQEHAKAPKSGTFGKGVPDEK